MLTHRLSNRFDDEFFFMLHATQQEEISHKSIYLDASLAFETHFCCYNLQHTITRQSCVHLYN